MVHPQVRQQRIQTLLHDRRERVRRHPRRERLELAVGIEDQFGLYPRVGAQQGARAVKSTKRGNDMDLKTFLAALAAVFGLGEASDPDAVLSYAKSLKANGTPQLDPKVGKFDALAKALGESAGLLDDPAALGAQSAGGTMAEDFVFKLQNPEGTIKAVAESALRLASVRMPVGVTSWIGAFLRSTSLTLSRLNAS